MADKKYPSFDFDLCVCCRICAQSCPFSYIDVNLNGIDEFRNLYPVVDKEKCSGCGICQKACPVGAIEMK